MRFWGKIPVAWNNTIVIHFSWLFMHAEIQKLQTRLHFRFQTKALPALPHQSVPTKGVSLIKQRTWRRGDQQKNAKWHTKAISRARIKSFARTILGLSHWFHLLQEIPFFQPMIFRFPFYMCIALALAPAVKSKVSAFSSYFKIFTS